MFDLKGTHPGVYDFTSLSRMDEELGIYWASRLIQGHTRLNRKVFIEIGHHDKLSPFETAANNPDTTVIGVEMASIKWYKGKVESDLTRFINSSVALFQFDASKLSGK
jgi:tRNA G46 methylase TrmB